MVTLRHFAYSASSLVNKSVSDFFYANQGNRGNGNSINFTLGFTSSQSNGTKHYLYYIYIKYIVYIIPNLFLINVN